MSQMDDPETSFLQEPLPTRLEQAVAWNRREWMVLKARAAGGEVRQREVVTWTYAGAEGEAMVLFPHLSEANAGGVLAEIAQFYAAQGPK